ncbi:hypothetical protein BSKO_05461 [Bryopsis sp. KO-2023]|nr:hypothetical protein BSKO_05461 [Bryopsis sp. KO-2023]
MASKLSGRVNAKRRCVSKKAIVPKHSKSIPVSNTMAMASFALGSRAGVRPMTGGRSRTTRSVSCAAHREDRQLTGVEKFGVAASAIALSGMIATPAFAVDEAVLAEKGRTFAEATAQVLRTVNGKEFKNTLKSAVDVALSVDPTAALDVIDAALETLETADVKALTDAVFAAEHATTVASEEGILIPPDTEIDAVVDALAKVGASCDSGKLAGFSGKATSAALSADKGKLAGLTFQGAKLGLSADKAAIAKATAAAGDLVLALGN